MKLKSSSFNAIGLVVAIFFLGCTKPSPDPLIGEWTGRDHTGQSASLIFNADGSAKLLQGNVVLDGSSIGGKVSWRIDRTHTPIHLDLVISRSTGETETLPMIARFITDKKLQIKMGDDVRSRPASFSEEKDINQIVLEKK